MSMSMSLRSGRKVVYNPNLTKTRMHCFPSDVETRIEKLETLNQYRSELAHDLKTILEKIKMRKREMREREREERETKVTVTAKDIRIRLKNMKTKNMLNHFTRKTDAVTREPENMIDVFVMNTIPKTKTGEVVYTTGVYLDPKDSDDAPVYAELKVSMKRTTSVIGVVTKLTSYIENAEVAINDYNHRMLDMLTTHKTELENIIKTSQTILECRDRLKRFH